MSNAEWMGATEFAHVAGLTPQAARRVLKRAAQGLAWRGITLTVRYASVFTLLADMRGMAASNLLPGRVALTRATLARLSEAFAARADDDGRTVETFDIVFVTGWAPDASQPKPARRGSATASLGEALKPR